MLIAETGIVAEGGAIAVTGTTFVEELAVLIPVKGIAFEGVANALPGTAFLEAYDLAIARTWS